MTPEEYADAYIAKLPMERERSYARDYFRYCTESGRTHLPMRSHKDWDGLSAMKAATLREAIDAVLRVQAQRQVPHDRRANDPDASRLRARGGRP